MTCLHSKRGNHTGHEFQGVGIMEATSKSLSATHSEFFAFCCLVDTSSQLNKVHLSPKGKQLIVFLATDEI